MIYQLMFVLSPKIGKERAVTKIKLPKKICHFLAVISYQETCVFCDKL